MIKKTITLILVFAVLTSSIPAFASQSDVDTFLLENGYDYPSVIPIAGHPRVFVTGNDIAKIRENLNHSQNVSMYNAVVSKSKIYCNGILSKKADNAITNFNSSYVEIMESCALLYLIEGKTDLGQKAITIAKNLLNTLENKPNTDQATRLGGNVIFSASLVYDWCYPLLSDTDKSEIISNILNLASLMEIGWPPKKGGDVLGHTSEAQLYKDLLAAGIAVYNENPDIYNIVAAKLLSGMIPSREYSYNSYFFTEGVSYGSFRYVFELMCSYLFKGIGYKAFSDKQKNPAYGMLLSRRPDGKYFSTGDDVTKYINSYDRTYCSTYFLAGNLYKDSLIKGEYYKAMKGYTPSTYGIADISPVLYLTLNDVTVDSDYSERELPLSFAGYGDANAMICRTSDTEGKESNNMVVRLNMPEYNYGNHQHMDTGHFDIYYKGNLAIDSGIYESAPFNDAAGDPVTSLAYASKHDMNYHKRTVAHNSMLVIDPGEKVQSVYTTHADGGQRLIHGSGYEPKFLSDIAKEENKVSEIISSDITNYSYSYLRGNLTTAYSDKVADYSRSFLFINFNDEAYPGALIVLDNITSKSAEFEKKWLLHTENEPVVKNNVTTAINNKGKLTNNILLPLNADIEKVGGDGNEFVSGGINFKAVPKGANHEAGKYRIEVTPTEEKTKDIFLNVLTVSDYDADTDSISPELISDDNSFSVVKIKDKVCYMAKEDELYSGDLFIKADKNYEYIFTGLEIGKWMLKDSSGNIISESESFSGRNTFSLKGYSGEYTLTHLEKCEIFKNSYVIKNNILYLPADKLIGKLDPYASKITKSEYKSEVNHIKYFKFDGSLTVNDVKVETCGKSYVSDGVLYVPAEDTAKAMGYYLTYDKDTLSVFISKKLAGNKNNITTIQNLKTKYDMLSKKHSVSLDVCFSEELKNNYSENAVLVVAGDKQGIIKNFLDFAIDGNTVKKYPYYIGTADVSNNKAHFEFKLSIPDESELHELEFLVLSSQSGKNNFKLKNTPAPQMFGSLFKTNHGHYAFATVYENPGDTVEEFGLVFSKTQKSPQIGEQDSIKLQSLFDYNKKGQFGIFMLFKNISQYNIRPYAIYKNADNNNYTVYGDSLQVNE